MSPLLSAAREAPLRTAEELLAGRTALTVLAPHPDDETLGCGALLHEAAALGVRCRVVCLTDGSASHPNSPAFGPERLARTRRAELEAALAALDPSIDLVWLGYPDTYLPKGGDARLTCGQRLAEAVPTGALVAATWAGDPHIDHERTASLAADLIASRPDLALLTYPIWGRFGDVVPDAQILRLRASDAARAAKRTALAHHATQMTRLIADDPDGFVMPEAQQAHFLGDPEIFIAT